jgi:hypothetical protein
MPGAWWIPCLFISSVILWLLISLKARREPLFRRLCGVVLIEAAYFAASYAMIHAKLSLFESFFGGILAAFLVERMIPGRQWRFSTSARSRTAADQHPPAGGKYNPSKNELDRVVPFSKGNSHT